MTKKPKKNSKGNSKKQRNRAAAPLAKVTRRQESRVNANVNANADAEADRYHGILPSDTPQNDAKLSRHDAEIAEQMDSARADDSIHEDILAFAQDATDVKGSTCYGDPLHNFTAVATLKRIFWEWFGGVADLQTSNYDLSEAMFDRKGILGRDSAHGHAIDMILTKLARIATCPSSAIVEDCYIDGAAYFALAREVAVRTERGDV